jgi:hypothetical protein
MELEWAKAKIERPEFARESDENFHLGYLHRHNVKKGLRSRSIAIFHIKLTVYVNNTAVVFTSREQLEKGIQIIQKIFASLEMEMHIG